jgi:hypothetical protein
MKKRQPQNARGSKERPLMKKEATPKRKGLKKPPTEKEATPECKGLSVKISDKKRVSKKAYFTELTLEGEGDAFQFKL